VEARCWWKVFPPEPPSSSLPIESGAATQSRCRMRNCRSTFAIWSFVGATGQFQTAQRRTRGTEHEMHVYFSTKKKTMRNYWHLYFLAVFNLLVFVRLLFFHSALCIRNKWKSETDTLRSPFFAMNWQCKPSPFSPMKTWTSAAICNEAA